MIIERIVKKDNETVIIYLDNSEKLFLSYEVLLKSGLRKGSEISKDRFDFLVLQNRKYHIRQKAISFLAKRIHSKRELEIKLRKKNYEKELIDDVLNELLVKELIDDSAFANQFADEKINRKKWGLLKVKSELFKKGIAAEIVEDVLKEYSDSENQISNALSLAEKKLNIISKRESDKKKLKQKTIAYLVSRGFSYNVALGAVQKIITDSDDQE
ncbi:MAG: recombination regulator RecX [Ignavibacteriaceae bacterium]|nr:recombination regulator RecX [Ignavibacteriaceae bacterium]